MWWGWLAGWCACRCSWLRSLASFNNNYYWVEYRKGLMSLIAEKNRLYCAFYAHLAAIPWRMGSTCIYCLPVSYSSSSSYRNVCNASTAPSTSAPAPFLDSPLIPSPIHPSYHPRDASAGLENHCGQWGSIGIYGLGFPAGSCPEGLQ